MFGECPARSLESSTVNDVVVDEATIPSEVAQWQSNRLLTGRFWVRVPASELAVRSEELPLSAGFHPSGGRSPRRQPRSLLFALKSSHFRLAFIPLGTNVPRRISIVCITTGSFPQRLFE